MEKSMEKEWLYETAGTVLGEAIGLRRELHRRPELSFRERETAERIARMLDGAGIPYRRVAGTGLLARVEGMAEGDACVVLRADIDALPVMEETGLEYASENPGVMHACGHDIHAACLMGTLLGLQRNRDRFGGAVLGLFQPGEETHPGGASLVLREGVLDGLYPVAVIGQHVAPELPTGTFGFRSGMYMASGDEIHITLRGTGGHGGLPHTLTDPVLAAAQLIVSLQQVVSRFVPAEIPAVLSFGKIVADGATNVIPAEVYLAGTLRMMSEQWRAKAKKRIREIAEGVAAAYGVTAEVDIRDGYPNVVNDAEVTERVKRVAEVLVGRERVSELGLRMTAEDFGFYTQRFRSVFYRLGVGFPDGRKTGGLHTSTFVADEEAMVHGIALMTGAALECLRNG